MAVREPVVILLRRARAAGITISRTAKGSASFEVPQSAAGLTEELRTREQQIVALFDWRQAPVAQASPCLLCGRPALLRDPSEHLPAHKVCVDQLLGG